MPWKNGRGQSLELFCAADTDQGGFFWRLTRAAITTDGPFSEFVGVQRHLLLLSGNGVILEHGNGKRDALRHHLDIAVFSGDLTTRASLIDGPVEDVNLMVRRDWGEGFVRPLVRREALRFVPQGEEWLLYALRGELFAAFGQDSTRVLPEGQLIKLGSEDKGIPWVVRGDSALAVSVTPHRRRC